MATLNPTTVGYTASSDFTSKTEPVWNPSKVYVNNDGNMGIFKFTTSINTMLGTTASTWSELKFSEAKVTAVVNSPFVAGTSSTSALSISSINSSYYFDIAVGVTMVPYGYQFTSNGLVDYITQIQISGSNANNGTLTFPLGDFFSKITNTNFTPNTSTWYFYIRNTKVSYRTYYNALSSSASKTTLTLTAEQHSPIKVYDSTTSTFKDATPYVYQNGVFVPVTAKVYKNNSFN